MMQVIPIQDVYSQTFRVTLSGQPCKINLYQKVTGLFCDVFVNDAPIANGVICQNLNRIVRGKYLGFTGDISFYDVIAKDDPTSPGLGSRYQLLYFDDL